MNNKLTYFTTSMLDIMCPYSILLLSATGLNKSEHTKKRKRNDRKQIVRTTIK